MAPIVHGLEAEFEAQVTFTYLDQDDSRTRDFQKALSYRFPPAMYLLDGEGKILRRWFGPVTEANLRLALEVALELGS
jgi:hypothetical protein